MVSFTTWPFNGIPVYTFRASFIYWNLLSNPTWNMCDVEVRGKKYSKQRENVMQWKPGVSL